MRAEEKPLAVCGIRCFRTFRLRNPNLTPCVLEPKHEGGHVYCEKVNAGIDYNSHSLHYMIEITRKSLKPVMVMEMDGQFAEETYEECAGLYQFMEYVRIMRGTNSTNT